MPVVVTIVDAGSIPVYLTIGAKAMHLRELGMSDKAIARALGVSDKTVARAALSWGCGPEPQSNTSSADGGCQGGSYS
jgi:hypothetical protein